MKDIILTAASISLWILKLIWKIITLPFTFLGWLGRRSLMWWLCFFVVLFAFILPVLSNLSTRI